MDAEHEAAGAPHRLFFMHIPKTAGSSVRRALEAAQATRGRCCWFAGGDAAGEAPGLACLEAALVAGGHVRWDDAAALPGGWRIGTVLRDPLERLLSLYSFQRMRIALGMPWEASPALRREVAERSFASLARDPGSRFFRFTLPAQCLYLGGAPRGFLPARGAALDRAAIAPMLGLALSRLEETAWLGVADTLDRDLETLARAFGWPPIGPAPRANRTAPEHRLAAADLDDGLLAEVRDRLEPDYLLLARARELAAARWPGGGGTGPGFMPGQL
ncbi:MAG: hypothetical protein ACKOWF_01265 [Chloroflexota bacterium]